MRARRSSEPPLPPEVGRVVIALCGDYDRREGVLRRGEAPPEVLCTYESLNRGIDRAIAAVCEESIRTQLRRDIGERRGARRSPIATISEGTYKRRKRESALRIARELNLV